VIAKGCSAVVHAAKLTLEGFRKMGGEEEGSPDAGDTDRDAAYPLAVKMMFNYEAESNATAIINAMHREITPAVKRGIPQELVDMGDGRRACQLPPHPNIVQTQLAFVDQVPDLDKAMALYPDALPRWVSFEIGALFKSCVYTLLKLLKLFLSLVS